jgi:hypothetical protein
MHMAELPIKFCKLTASPDMGPGNRDGFRWNVGLEEDGQVRVVLVVDLSGSGAVETGLGSAEINRRFPRALQRYAAGQLTNDRPVLDQVVLWSEPILLTPDKFEGESPYEDVSFG